MTKNILTQNEVKRLFNYNKNTGDLIRKVTTSPTSIQGSKVGYKTQRGYLTVRIKDKQYMVHRIIWLYVYGNFPLYGVDHINGIKTDNRLDNLRDVPQAINGQNIRASKSCNKSGFLGVSYSIGNKKWRSRIAVNGKSLFIGLFETPELAHQAYIQAKRQIHVGCTI